MSIRASFLLLLASLSLPWMVAEEPPRKPVTAIERFEPVDATRDRTVPVKVSLPASKSPQPVVIFSHGLGGSRENGVYLGEHWAAAGYVAVFVQHPGSDESVWKNAGRGERLTAMKTAASLRSTLDRYADIPFVLDQLELWNAGADHPLKGRLDFEHIGMCGHSFGAVTTQGMMGQRFLADRTFGDPRLDAFFPMSPSGSRGISSEKAFGHIKAPVLCMTGTEDTSIITPDVTAATRLEVYASLPAGDKYQLVFEGGQHSAFSDGALFNEKQFEHHHGAIRQISTRFWDAYLRGDAAAKAWLQSERPRSDCQLLAKDVWEWK
jgi:predicted dienelactone hydrolase